jgi:hypothetical protein
VSVKHHAFGLDLLYSTVGVAGLFEIRSMLVAVLCLAASAVPLSEHTCMVMCARCQAVGALLSKKFSFNLYLLNNMLSTQVATVVTTHNTACCMYQRCQTANTCLAFHHKWLLPLFLILKADILQFCNIIQSMPGSLRAFLAIFNKQECCYVSKMPFFV